MAETKMIRNVAVYLGSTESPVPEFRQAVVDFAGYLAEHDMTLVFGGSNGGMMKILADEMLRRGGRVVGVFTRCLSAKWLRDDLTESVITENLAERKAVMLDRADVAVALPGSLGTFDELFDALAQCKLRRRGLLGVGVLNVNGFFDPVFELLNNSRAAGFASKCDCSLLKSGRTPEELFRQWQIDPGKDPGRP